MRSMVYEPVEEKDRAEIRELQDERLRETVERAYENVPFYREQLDELGVAPEDISGVDLIERLLEMDR